MSQELMEYRAETGKALWTNRMFVVCLHISLTSYTETNAKA